MAADAPRVTFEVQDSGLQSLLPESWPSSPLRTQWSGTSTWLQDDGFLLQKQPYTLPSPVACLVFQSTHFIHPFNIFHCFRKLTLIMMPLYTSQQPPCHDVVQFGNLIKRQLFLETTSPAGTMPILTPRESPLITERLLQSQVDIETAYRKRLELGPEFYLGVKQHLMAILQAWDAIIDEKDAFDKLGRLIGDRQFIESFLICTDTIPNRVNIGMFGPHGLQSNPIALPPLPVAVKKERCGNTGWLPKHAKGPDSLQGHSADVLALSDYEVDDTTADEEDENEDDNDSDDYYYDDEDYEDDEEFENILRPPTPYPVNLLDGRRLFPEDESEDWHSDLQKLVNETSDTVKSELSDWEDFTTPREQHTPTPVDRHGEGDNARPLDIVYMGTQPVIEKQKRCEPKRPATSKKRGFDKVSGRESGTLDEGGLRSKRQRG